MFLMKARREFDEGWDDFEFTLISIKVLIETSTFWEIQQFFSLPLDGKVLHVCYQSTSRFQLFLFPSLSFVHPNLSLDLNLLLNIVGSDKHLKLKNLFFTPTRRRVHLLFFLKIGQWDLIKKSRKKQKNPSNVK